MSATNSYTLEVEPNGLNGWNVKVARKPAKFDRAPVATIRATPLDKALEQAREFIISDMYRRD